jgi:LPXTG-motif cell wall-anchored protein
MTCPIQKKSVQAKLMRVFWLFMVGLLFLAARPVPSQAAVNLSLSPASGSFTGLLSVGLYVNANPATDQIAGISVNINYTGPVNYNAYDDGSDNCDVSIVEPSTGSVHLECLASFDPGYISGPSTVATLSFIPTGTGTVTMEVEVVEIGYITGSLGTVSGGTYTVQPGSLPDTGLFDSPVVAGGLILMAGAAAVIFSKRQYLMGLYGSHSRVVIQKSQDKSA